MIAGVRLQAGQPRPTPRRAGLVRQVASFGSEGVAPFVVNTRRGGRGDGQHRHWRGRHFYARHVRDGRNGRNCIGHDGGRSGSGFDAGTLGRFFRHLLGRSAIDLGRAGRAACTAAIATMERAAELFKEVQAAVVARVVASRRRAVLVQAVRLPIPDLRLAASVTIRVEERTQSIMDRRLTVVAIVMLEQAAQLITQSKAKAVVAAMATSGGGTSRRLGGSRDGFNFLVAALTYQ